MALDPKSDRSWLTCPISQNDSVNVDGIEHQHRETLLLVFGVAIESPNVEQDSQRDAH